MTPDPYRMLYRDYLLVFEPATLPDGRFKAKVVITALTGDKTIAQRFLDFGVFDTKEAAAAHARGEGIAWVDRQVPAGR